MTISKCKPPRYIIIWAINRKKIWFTYSHVQWQNSTLTDTSYFHAQQKRRMVQLTSLSTKDLSMYIEYRNI